MPKNNYGDDEDDDDLLMALQSMEPCGNCGADGAKIPCMSGCGEVFYCSRVARRAAKLQEHGAESWSDARCRSLSMCIVLYCAVLYCAVLCVFALLCGL